MSPDTDSHDPLEPWLLAIGPWRPRPLSRPDPPMPTRRRFAIVAAVVAGHVLMIALLAIGSRYRAPPPREITTLVFVAPPVVAPEPPLPASEPAPPVLEPPPRPPRRPPSASASSPLPAVPTPVPPAATPRSDAPMVAVEATPRPRTSLRLYDSNGALELPDDVVARLDEVTSPQRTFDFQLPGLEEAGTFMQRQPALVYEPTRFDGYWKPDQDVLTELLEEAVRKSTGSIEIPIPGSPGSKLVCTVSVLAFGGGCGIVNNNDGYVPVLDDPTTLNPEEDRQCQAWWEQIVAANGQDAWRQTRALYEFSCRKPLEKITEPP